MTKQEKARDDKRIEKVLEYLCESHLETVGGYPYDWIEYQGQYFIAELDGFKEYGATLIKQYSREQLLTWYEEAKQYRRETRNADWEEAFGETTPKAVNEP